MRSKRPATSSGRRRSPAPGRAGRARGRPGRARVPADPRRPPRGAAGVDADRSLPGELADALLRRDARRRLRSATTASLRRGTWSGRGTSRSSSSPTRRGTSSRLESASAPCSADTRRCSRSALPALDADLRARMSEAAVAFARDRLPQRRHGRVHARRARFLLPRAERRDQVEHPVTELVTGVDLVREQLRVAQGERLEASNSLLQGHAVEVRLYAEDPRTFLPQGGRLGFASTSVRVDAGVEEGDEVNLGLRPADREADRAREHAPRLSSGSTTRWPTPVAGVTTNLPFLRWLVTHPKLRAGETTTAFLVENPPLSEPPARLPTRSGARRGG